MAAKIQSGILYNDERFESLNIRAREIHSSEFINCDFHRCTFIESSFRDCQFVTCHFMNCDLSLIKIDSSSFSGAKFEKSKVMGIDWTRGHWSEVRIRQPLVFLECILDYSIFLGLDLVEVKFIACQAMNVDFREVNLSKADFSNTDLSSSLFVGTRLGEADFRTAYNYKIDVSQNDIKRARFSLPEAMSLLYSLDIDLSEDDLTGTVSGSE